MRDYSEIEAITVAYGQMIYNKGYDKGFSDGHNSAVEENNNQQEHICLSCRYLNNHDKCVACSRLIRKDNYEAAI